MTTLEPHSRKKGPGRRHLQFNFQGGVLRSTRIDTSGQPKLVRKARLSNLTVCHTGGAFRGVK